MEAIFEKFLRSRFHKELQELQEMYRDDPIGFENHFDDRFDECFDNHYNSPEAIGWLEEEFRAYDNDVDAIMRRLKNDPEYVRERIRLEVYLHITNA